MQTESNARPAWRTHLAIGGFILALSLTSTYALEARAATPIPMPTAPTMASPTMASPTVVNPTTAATPLSPPLTTATAPALVAPMDTIEAPKAPTADAKSDKGFSAVQSKVPDSVKEVMKRLDNNNIVTLDDLNSARQAVARIEALIDIEKHISELEKIRSDREDGGSTKSSKTLASNIPASALNPPHFSRLVARVASAGITVHATKQHRYQPPQRLPMYRVSWAAMDITAP